MEQKIEYVEDLYATQLKNKIQEITSQMNAKGFKLTDISVWTDFHNHTNNAILVFTKE